MEAKEITQTFVQWLHFLKTGRITILPPVIPDQTFTFKWNGRSIELMRPNGEIQRIYF